MANAVVIDNLKQHCGHETVSLLNSNYDIDNLEEWITEDYCTDNIGINFSSEHIEGTNSENIPMPDIEI